MRFRIISIPLWPRCDTTALLPETETLDVLDQCEHHQRSRRFYDRLLELTWWIEGQIRASYFHLLYWLLLPTRSFYAMGFHAFGVVQIRKKGIASQPEMMKLFPPIRGQTAIQQENMALYLKSKKSKPVAPVSTVVTKQFLFDDVRLQHY